MKGFRRVLLFGFTIIYWVSVRIRNFLFDIGFRKTFKPHVPTIVIGNLEAGGTGKTPHSEYLIELLGNKYRTAFLSRGYKRSTSGFLAAGPKDTPQTIGDEPYQVHSKYPEVTVAVAEERVLGIKRLTETINPEVIILDDAFQHRKVKPGFAVVLMSFHRPFWKDYLLPIGRLREPVSSLKRADAVIITKCPKTIPQREREEFEEKVRSINDIPLFFSYLKYGNPKPLSQTEITINRFPGFAGADCLLVTGIVNPDPLLIHIQTMAESVNQIKYGDHHNYTVEDIKHIMNRFRALSGSKKMIITTEKDAVKLKDFTNFGLLPGELVYYIPVMIAFHHSNGRQFDQMITNYVRANQ